MQGRDTNGPFKGIPYDGNDEGYSELYHLGNNDYQLWRDGWLTNNKDFQKHWFLRIKDLIDKYKPDLLYSDSPLPFGQYGLDMVAHLYNTSAANHDSQSIAVYNQKHRSSEIFSVGVHDIERSQEDKITEYYWQTDTSVGDWFYNLKDKYKSWNVIMETIVDISSKNGNILLNIVQKPDGTIDHECEFMLKNLAEWMSINNDGIFGTRHWRVCSEGTGSFKKAGDFDEKAVEWQPGDVRFTYKNNTVYAFLMRWPGNMAIIKSLPATKESVSSVSLLGYGDVKFEQNGAGLIVTIPVNAPSEFVSCLKISLK